MEVLFCSASLCSIEFVGHLHGPWGLKKDMICVRRSWRDSCSKSVHVNRRRRRKTCNNKDRWSRVSVVNKVELESDIIYHIIEHLQHYWAIGTQLHTKSPLFNKITTFQHPPSLQDTSQRPNKCLPFHEPTLNNQQQQEIRLQSVQTSYFSITLSSKSLISDGIFK